MSEEYISLYGTPLASLDENNVHQVRGNSISDQVATDKLGKRRFHGAFTGGFSAGYFNSVGSKEGWTPSAFVSSRSKRASGTLERDPTLYMDDEDLDHFGIANRQIKTTSNYEEANSSVKKRRTENWSGLIPGQPVLNELLKPAPLTIGMKLLIKFGWKPGQGVGPRVSRQYKRKARLERQRYGDVIGFSGEDEGDESDQEPCQEVSFAPEDNQIQFLQEANTKQFGLGYKPLDSRSILGQNFNDVPGAFQMREKNKLVSIRGQAFGIGAIEDDDDDVYAIEDMSEYDFVLGSTNDSKFSSRRQEKSVSALRDALEGFEICSEPDVKAKEYPLPLIPPNFSLEHKSRRRRFDAKEGSSRDRLSAEERRRLTSLQPSVEIRSGVKSTVSKCSKMSSAYHNSEDSETKQSSEALSNAITSTAECRGHKTEWEREREELTSRLGPSLSMSSRFTKAIYKEESDGLKEGLNKSFERKPNSCSQDELPEEHSAEALPADVRAARAKLFGPLTQKTFDWRPNDVLCKRFNVPVPVSRSWGSVGAASKSAEKFSIFNFIPVVPSASPAATVHSALEVNHSSAPPVPGRCSKEERERGGAEDVDDNFGLKVPISDPPSMDLFKAIFQDSSSESDDECPSQDLSSGPAALSGGDSKTPPIAAPLKEASNPISENGEGDERERKPFENDFSERVGQHLNLKAQKLYQTSDKEGKGVFKGIDFAALNEYRNRSSGKLTSEAHQTKVSDKDAEPRSNESSDERGSVSSRADDPDSDSYMPSLPPHMFERSSNMDRESGPEKVLKGSFSKLKEKRMKKKKSKSHKHKKKHKKEKKRK